MMQSTWKRLMWVREEVFQRWKSIKGDMKPGRGERTCFFTLGSVSWKVLAVSSHTSYLNSVYERTDRHKWPCFGAIMMALGKRQRHWGRKHRNNRFNCEWDKFVFNTRRREKRGEEERGNWIRQVPDSHRGQGITITTVVWEIKQY